MRNILRATQSLASDLAGTRLRELGESKRLQGVNLSNTFKISEVSFEKYEIEIGTNEGVLSPTISNRIHQS